MELNKQEIDELRTHMLLAEEEVKKGIIGQEELIRQVMLALLAGGNILLEGVPGLGKTQLVKAFSKVLSVGFQRIQFTPDLMPADVTGTNLIIKENGKNVFQFEKGPVFANLVLADEINRATPKTQSALLEAMQEQTVTVGKTTYPLPQPFMVFATQNPIENEGTYPLPEAQLDRFLFQLNVAFPTLDALKKIMDITVGEEKIQLQPILSGEDLLKVRELIGKISIAEPVQEYALQLVIHTHPELKDSPEMTKKYVTVGASPRAAQAIYATAKARAFLEGRYNVSFEDIKYVAVPALRHRIALNFEGLSEGKSVDGIVEELLCLK